MRHKESMKLVMSIIKPSTIIFCHEPVADIDYTYPSYSGLLFSISKEVKKLILCIDNVYEKPQNPNEVSQLACYWLTQIYKEKYGIDSLVVTKEKNLLKEIKKFIVKTEGGGIISSVQ